MHFKSNRKYKMLLLIKLILKILYRKRAHQENKFFRKQTINYCIKELRKKLQTLIKTPLSLCHKKIKTIAYLEINMKFSKMNM